uniref:Putative glycoside hydrolase n=1 Tax=viral metagenome TaxID=1070528 RepID=A0A6H2A514_9ZZZZ
MAMRRAQMVLAALALCAVTGKGTENMREYPTEWDGLAASATRGTDVPANLLIAIACHESAWGTAPNAIECCNPFGMMARSGGLQVFDSETSAFARAAYLLNSHDLYAQPRSVFASEESMTLLAARALAHVWCPDDAHNWARSVHSIFHAIEARHENMIGGS